MGVLCWEIVTIVEGPSSGFPLVTSGELMEMSLLLSSEYNMAKILNGRELRKRYFEFIETIS